MAKVNLYFESIPPIASSRPWIDEEVVCVIGGAATSLHYIDCFCMEYTTVPALHFPKSIINMVVRTMKEEIIS
jgi:hypothetical protein